MENESKGCIVERGEFKGKPILILKRDEEDKYPFSFGMTKAKLIMDNIAEIKKFVDENSKIFIELCKKLNLSNNDFIRTTEQRHVKKYQEIFKKV